LGPALGALFYVIFRDVLSSVTEDWLLYFGLLFVFFILFSPTGLVGIYERISTLWRKKPILDAAMAHRKAGEIELPSFSVPEANSAPTILEASVLRRHFGGIKAVDGVSFSVRSIGLHALIGPNGAGKTTAFNLISGLHPLDGGNLRFRSARYLIHAACAENPGWHWSLVSNYESISWVDSPRKRSARSASQDQTAPKSMVLCCKPSGSESGD
jgi:ABC-type siderophore export system fused ATPase/permease subunit